MPTLRHATARELADAARQHLERLASIDAGAPATPDSADIARRALERIHGEQDRRGVSRTSSAVSFVTTYAPDIYEVIHPTRERIGSVTRYGHGRGRSWDAIDAHGRAFETFDTLREAGAAVLGAALVADAAVGHVVAGTHGRRVV